MNNGKQQSRDRHRRLARYRRRHRRAARQRRLYRRHQLCRQTPGPKRWPARSSRPAAAPHRAGRRQRSRRGRPHVRRGGCGVRRRRCAGQQCRHHAAATIAESDDALFDQPDRVNLKGTFNTLREAASGCAMADASSTVVQPGRPAPARPTASMPRPRRRSRR